MYLGDLLVKTALPKFWESTQRIRFKIDQNVSYNSNCHFQSQRQQAQDLETVITSWSDRFDAGLELHLMPYASEPARMSPSLRTVDEALQYVRDAYANSPEMKGLEPSQEK